MNVIKLYHIVVVYSFTFWKRKCMDAPFAIWNSVWLCLHEQTKATDNTRTQESCVP